MLLKKSHLVLIIIASTTLMSACGKKDEADNSKSDTQVVAKVNGDEILINQINFQLARATQNNNVQLNEQQSKTAAKQILTRLVDEQLLKQQAIETKLDRDPKILQALESSKNEILAQAYLEQIMLKASKPSTAEIDKFYAEHPELFESRRVFRLQELVLNIDKNKFAEVEANLKTFKNVNEAALWLKSKNYPFTANSNVRGAEQLPADLLKRIQVLKDGEFVAVPTENSLNIVNLAASQAAPIARDKATPIIEQYFLNQNKMTLVKKEMAAMNAKAKIEYVGAFSDMKKQDTAAGNIKPAPTTLESATSVNETTKPLEAKGTEAGMNKGLSGL